MDHDEEGNNLITEKYLRDLCEENLQYDTPHLNDTLYLHYKGKIEYRLVTYHNDQDLKRQRILRDTTT